MLTGFYVFVGDGNAKYTPPFPRGGLSATFFVQVLDLVGNPTDLVAVVQHKNIEDTSFTNAQAFGTINTVSVASVSASGLKEILRIAFTPTGNDPWDGFLILIPAPSWRPY